MDYIVDESCDGKGQRIDKYIVNLGENYTRSYVQKLMEDNKITVNNELIKASYRLKVGDIIKIDNLEIKETSILAEDIPLEVIYEDEDIIIVNKPKGMVVHPGNGNSTSTMVNSLMFSHKDKLSGINGAIRPGIVHRIDKDTTGILVVAKNDKAHKILSETFKAHNITRKYVALVSGIVDKNNIKIDLPIGRDANNRIKMAVSTNNSRNAITHIKVLERFYTSNYTLIEATLETGRTHQIRVHMSYIGHPLVGDNVYGKGKNEFNVTGQMLHAKILGFEHPTTKKYVEFEQEIPEEFKNILKELREKENRANEL